MTKVIIISGGSLDSFYDQTLQHLHDKYHSYPSSLSGEPLSATETARITYYDAMARHAAQGANTNQRVPLGKRIV